MCIMLGFIEGPVSWLEKFGGNGGGILLALGILCLFILFAFIGLGDSRVFGFMVAILPIVLPFVMFALFFEYWVAYVQYNFDLGQGRTTLELKIPQDVFKSPEAMEMVLLQLHQTAAPDNHLQTYIDGKHPPVHSLELVSRGGEIKFYLNVPKKKFKNIAEAQLYAQYPGIEVRELDIDYTAEIPHDTDRFAYFGIHFGLKKPDAYPIKTYLDYKLDSTSTEEEQKIDPISSMIEAISNIGPGEHIWVQVLIDANREVTFKEGALHKEEDWKGAAREEINKILEKAKKREGVESGGAQRLTEGERDAVRAIERSLGKNAFNTAIRAMYIAEKDKYNPGERIGAIITGWRSYDDLNRNAIGVKWRTDFDWNWWQDPKGHKRDELKADELKGYKKRRYERKGKGDGKKVMTTEELATIFHIPGKVISTPTLERIPSKRSEAPANLPTGTYERIR